MQIKINPNGYVIGYAILGGIENGVDVEDIPLEVRGNPHIYKYIDGEFILDENVVNEKEKEKLKDLKDAKMQEAEDKLLLFFKENPLKGNFHNNKVGEYAVTKDVFSKMQGEYNGYLLDKQLGLPHMLQWNEIFGECEDWEETEFLNLLVAVKNHVHNYESVKQSFIVAINNCNKIEELEAICIEYKKNS